MSHSALLYIYVICIGKYMNSIFIEYITEIKIAMIILQLTTWRLYFEELEWEGLFSIDVSRLIYFGYISIIFWNILVIFWEALVRRYILQLLVPDWGPRRHPSTSPPLCVPNSPILTAFQHFKTVSSFLMKGKIFLGLLFAMEGVRVWVTN